MKRKMMKFLSLFLSVSMAINMFTVPVFAAPEDESTATEQSAVVEDDAVENVENGTEQEDVSNGTESDADAAPAEETPADETPAAETPEADEPEEAPKRETISVEESYKAFTVNVNDIEISVDGESVIVLGAGEEPAEVDTSSPTISVVEEELNNIRVLNDEGESVALTPEQIQTVLYLYQQYLDQWKDNANLLGVQTPFFLQYNDKEKDGLGVLGEMLVLAGYTVDDVRNGKYKYDDLVGMIQNFYYADQFGLKFYTDAINSARAAVEEAVEKSGAKTDVQKMLVINDWLAHHATFDMSYIMNMGEEEPVMSAPDPQKHEHYDEIYKEMYALYENQITQQFHDQIYDNIVAQFRQQYYEGAIKNIVMEGYKSQVRQSVIDQAVESGRTEEEAETAADEYMEENADQIEADASDYATQYMEDNADAISEDAAGFVEKNFGSDVAAKVSAGADEFIADAEENGVEVDPENAPGYKMTIEEITQNTMKNEPILDLNEDGENETTANQAIPIFAEQAAQGLTNGILGAWEGNHIGILAEGTGVCCGYAKAFAYLLQYMNPKVYGVNGDGTDMSVAENWKTAEDLYYTDGSLDIDKDYVVDLVRITFQTDVTMYGKVNEGFNSDHFWNAVKVDGQWYYIDPCYIDVYTEVMSRDRVEMDGNLNHMYFMFSHSTAREMYDGYMGGEGIKTLYADAATDTSYEDSWYARISSNTYSDGNYFYYLYDSSDMFGLMREMNPDSSSGTDYEKFMEMTNAEYKLVRHAISSNDVAEGGADSDYEALIEFNHKVSEDDDDDTTVARVNVNGKMVENELLTELFAQFKAESEIYPSIAISTALYGGKLYFNLSNCILSYDLSSGAVEKVKEYNTVHAERDTTKAFGGMAFSVVASGGTHTVENHPIASMTIKDDGKMYVSIATNFAYISGKDPHDCTDSKSNGYGYKFEESNYNSNYSTYFDMDEISAEYGEIDSDSQDNDNDEFMWSAVFVDTLSMDHLAGGSHSYSQVTVDPFCGRDGFTENRCSTCGAIEAGTRVEEEGTACDHHYIHFDETYYTKDDNDNWNTGKCYVCTICGSAVSEPVEPEKNAQESDEEFAERQEQYEKDKAEYEAIKANAGHVYTSSSADSVTWNTDESGSIVSATVAANTHMVCDPCEGKELDVLQEEVTSVDLEEEVTLNDIDKKATGKCEEGLTVTYTATGTTEAGTKLSASKTEKTEAGGHDLKGKFNWEKNQTTHEATATSVQVTCTRDCGTEFVVDEPTTVKDEAQSKAATRKEEGVNVFTATAVVKDQDGNEVGKVTDTVKMPIPALGNPFEDVAEDAYYYDAVLWAYDNGITQGKDDTHFLPNNICNRAQVVTFFWRAMGEPEPESTVNPFVDVAEDAYYYKAVLWAYYKGVTTGKDETHFQPNATVTRSQVVTFMYRNEGEPAVKTTENPFVDVTEDKYYYNAVLWAYENDITTGKDDTHFLPGDECKRCQVVTFLYRAYGDEK